MIVMGDVSATNYEGIKISKHVVSIPSENSVAQRCLRMSSFHRRCLTHDGFADICKTSKRRFKRIKFCSRNGNNASDYGSHAYDNVGRRWCDAHNVNHIDGCIGYCRFKHLHAPTGNTMICITWQMCDSHTSSNEIFFRVTGPLCGEFTAHRWISVTKASDAELWCFLRSVSEQTVE